MGREIRRVPPGWEHPRNESGDYIPLFDDTYDNALAEWWKGREEWQAGTHEDSAEYGDRYTWEEWHGEAPRPSEYRPAFDAEPTHYQVYEDVSEGTPVSPVFATLDDMERWLISEGFSPKAAGRFVQDGWAPSFVIVDGQFSGTGIHSLDLLPD